MNPSRPPLLIVTALLVPYPLAAAVIIGVGQGVVPYVSSLGPGGSGSSFLAFDVAFLGGVRVAGGDVNGDGHADFVAGAGPGGSPAIKVFDGQSGSELHFFSAYASGFSGGVYVAAGDINGDGKADIITGPDSGGGPQVKVFSGADGGLLSSFFAYNPGWLGGVRVAAGDLTGDGVADIITSPGAGGAPQVNVFNGATAATEASFFAYDGAFRGGVFVAAGDVNGDGKADIITGPGAGAGPQVKVFDGVTLNLITSFFAYDVAYTGGVHVTAADLNGDGLADIVTAPGSVASGSAELKIFNPANGYALDSSFLYDYPSATDGIYLAATPVPEPSTVWSALTLTSVAMAGVRLAKTARR
jgi:hypothetical protein